MADGRFPTLDEFWKRLQVRGVEHDLQDELRARTRREDRPVLRVADEPTAVAVVARMLPGDVPPKALAVFLDDVFDKQLGRADDRDGLMPRDELIPTGFKVLDEAARDRHWLGFADLDADRQDGLLADAENGKLKGPKGFDASTWFRRVRGLLLLGFGSDPRGMVQMGFPGPSYKPGHVWLDREEVAARSDRRPGYLRL